MLLPVAKPATGLAEADSGNAAAMTAAPGTALNILVVEDDERVLAATVDAVGELGHRAVACGNPLDAEALVEREDGFDLILSDVLMPELTAPEMAAQPNQRWPDPSVLFVTGFAGDAGEMARFGDHAEIRRAQV